MYSPTEKTIGENHKVGENAREANSKHPKYDEPIEAVVLYTGHKKNEVKDQKANAGDANNADANFCRAAAESA